jgi:hypothetical protein
MHPNLTNCFVRGGLERRSPKSRLRLNVSSVSVANEIQALTLQIMDRAMSSLFFSLKEHQQFSGVVSISGLNLNHFPLLIIWEELRRET